LATELTTFEELGKTFDILANNIYHSTESKVKAISNKVAEFVIQSTPIDRGTASYGWMTAIDNLPGSSIIGKREVPPVAGAKADAIARNKSVTNLFKIDSNQRIYICNYLDYMLELDLGWSDQAPANFIYGSVVSAIEGTARIEITQDLYRPMGGSYGR